VTHPKPAASVAARARDSKTQAPQTPAARPAEASAAKPASAPSSGSAPAADPGWNSLFMSWLAAHKTYPEAARRRGEEGNVTLRVDIADNGLVRNVVLIASSGNSLLDTAAEALFRGAQLPKPQVELTRTVRLRYRLAD
jgi:protein TonB